MASQGDRLFVTWYLRTGGHIKDREGPGSTGNSREGPGSTSLTPSGLKVAGREAHVRSSATLGEAGRGWIRSDPIRSDQVGIIALNKK